MVAEASTPNVVIVHCHDLGRHLHCLGARSVTSPHLDAFAASGIVLEDMFATAPQCSPSRASLFTGRWPHANGVMGLTHRDFAWDLHPGEVHLARRLAAAGYATELIGVHHESRSLPDSEVAARLGFDRVDTGGLALDVARRAELALHRLSESAKPFYLQVGFIEPHRLPGRDDPEGTMGFVGDHISPDSERGVDVPPYLEATPSARQEIAELQGAIRHMDAAVGVVLDAITSTGREDDTVVVFTTDHGLALPRAKCSLFDPGLEIACIVRYPAIGWTGGLRVSGLLSNLDVLPTILEVTGVADETEPRELHGHSFVGLVEGTQSHINEVLFGELTYHDYYDPRRSVRTARWKLIGNFSSSPGFMDPSQSWNRRCTPLRGSAHTNLDYHPSVELYDLVADPHELLDVASVEGNGSVVADLCALLFEWMRRTGDPLLLGAVTGPLHRATSSILQEVANSVSAPRQ